MNYKKLKKQNKELKRRIEFEKENTEMYHELYKTALQEHQHQGIQKMAFDDLIADVYDLLWKKIKHSLIEKYIENWREKIVLGDSIHFDEIVWIDKCRFNN